MKNIFFKRIYIVSIQLLIFITSWLSFDILYSNFFFEENKYGCFNFKENFYDLKPNCIAKEKIVKTAKHYKVLTDESGNRYSGEKRNKSNENLIVFLGDSFTYGVGLEYEKTFVHKIEKFNKKYTVLNLAVPSYSPTAHLYQLEKLIEKKIYPKKVILVVDLTDVSDEAGRWESKNKKPSLIGNYWEFELLNKSKKKHSDKWREFKYNNFKGSKQLINYINNFTRLVKIKFKKKIDKDYSELGITRMGDFTYIEFEKLDQKWWLPHGVNGGLKKIENNIKKISKLAKKNNAEFYIVIYPWAVTLEYGQNIFNWELYGKHLCKVSSCKKLINLFPDFNDYKKKNLNWSTDLYFLHDTHWNEKGHGIVANKILIEIFN